MSDYLKSRQQHIFDGRPLPQKKQYKIPAKSKKRSEKEAKEKAERGADPTALQKWYDNIMKREEAVCWETGQTIDKKDKVAWHGSIAHVLSKSLFPSIATHPSNYLILSMYGGAHGQYDSSWENAQKMKVWKEAVDRFLMIEPDIAQEERRRIPECFLKALEENNPFPGQ